jgi:hypothetical protein
MLGLAFLALPVIVGWVFLDTMDNVLGTVYSFAALICCFVFDKTWQRRNQELVYLWNVEHADDGQTERSSFDKFSGSFGTPSSESSLPPPPEKDLDGFYTQDDLFVPIEATFDDDDDDDTTNGVCGCLPNSAQTPKKATREESAEGRQHATSDDSGEGRRQQRAKPEEVFDSTRRFLPTALAWTGIGLFMALSIMMILLVLSIRVYLMNLFHSLSWNTDSTIARMAYESRVTVGSLIALVPSMLWSTGGAKYLGSKGAAVNSCWCAGVLTWAARAACFATQVCSRSGSPTWRTTARRITTTVHCSTRSLVTGPADERTTLHAAHVSKVLSVR